MALADGRRAKCAARDLWNCWRRCCAPYELERGIPPSDPQHPKDSFPLAAKPLEGEGVAARCLRSKPELRRMGANKKAGAWHRLFSI